VWFIFVTQAGGLSYFQEALIALAITGIPEISLHVFFKPDSVDHRYRHAAPVRRRTRPLPREVSQ